LGEKLMKVLMQSRKNFFELRGGDTVQLEKTKMELEKLGVEVDFSLDFEPDLSNYDLVHLSNVTRIQETYLHVKNAKKQGKPIVLSTIYWPMDEFERLGQVGIRKFINSHVKIDTEEKIKAIARYLKDKNSRNEATRNLWKIGYTKMQKYVVDNVDYFLPNSEMEMDEFCKSFGVEKDRYKVIPNAIDADIARKQDEVEIPKEFEKYRNAIICVGRIEPRKNQLSLVKALDKSNYKLILVGAVSDNQKSYFNEIKEIMDRNPNFYYISKIENSKLYQLYKVCKVSTLPSWLDTPGLVSLEAAAMGCNLAISSKGSTTEYFINMAEYCLPDDINGIRSAIDRAYAKPQNDKLKNRIFENYTWKIAGQKTLEAYKTILDEERTAI
jgi:glycosyltransferase involved in cell wall biosynthesis